MRRHGRFLLTLASMLFAVAPAAAATFAVNDTADTVDAAPGDGRCATAAGTCTLRAAIQETNALPGADTIMVPAGTYLITIPGRGEDAAATGDLDIADALTIIGAGAASTIVDGNGIDRVFEVVNSAAVVAISSLTIRHGDPGSVAGDTDGGGLYNQGTLTLSDVVVANNTASAGNGGGISSINDLTLTGCTVSGNTAAISGGGIESPLTITLTNVTVSGNMSGNTPGAGGGGIANDDIAALATLSSVTIADNSAAPSNGGGFYNLGRANLMGGATLRYVIVADSPSGDNCAGSGGTLTSQGHNLDSGNTCGFTGPGDLVNVDPRLGPLQDNGGPTPTQALLAGSPAIDAGGNDCPPPLTDQRGFSRPADGDGDGDATCDIGAYEFDATPPCRAGATFPSIDCRLDELIRTVQTVVPAGALRNGLGSILMRAKAQTGQAEQAMAAGKKRREKLMLGRANGSLRKFNARLRTRKAKKQVPGGALSSMMSAAGQLRHDLVMLRSSS